MSSLTGPLRGLIATAGALALLAACSERPSAQPAPAASQAPAAAVGAPAKAPIGAVGEVPAGFEVLETVTPSGRTRFFVEIADNDTERERGLMFRKSLAPDRGMLFDFSSVRHVQPPAACAGAVPVRGCLQPPPRKVRPDMWALVARQACEPRYAAATSGLARTSSGDPSARIRPSASTTM